MIFTVKQEVNRSEDDMKRYRYMKVQSLVVDDVHNEKHCNSRDIAPGRQLLQNSIQNSLLERNFNGICEKFRCEYQSVGRDEEKG